MIIPDVNLLLYAEVRGFASHSRARRWWEHTMNGRDEVGLTAPTLFGFLRLVTNPRVVEPPLAMNDAVERVDAWLERPHVRFVLPGPQHLEIAFALLRPLGTAHDLTTDVQLAAIAIEYQGEIHSNDRDFGRFPGLRWVNPLR